MNEKKDIKILAYIPARSGSKRIKNKNIRNFCGKPLIAHAISLALSNEYIDKVIVDTDSPSIAHIAKKYKADVPFLRPRRLAQDTSQLIDSVIYLLKKLKNEKKYQPDYVLLLQATSPLSSQDDINKCIETALKENAESVVTLCRTEPLLFNMKPDKTIALANVKKLTSTNSQELPKAYMLNGNVFLIKTKALYRERKFFTKKTKGILSSMLQSVDIDTPEDWALAEIIYKHRKSLENRSKKINSNYNEKSANHCPPGC